MLKKKVKKNQREENPFVCLRLSFPHHVVCSPSPPRPLMFAFGKWTSIFCELSRRSLSPVQSRVQSWENLARATHARCSLVHCICNVYVCQRTTMMIMGLWRFVRDGKKIAKASERKFIHDDCGWKRHFPFVCILLSRQLSNDRHHHHLRVKWAKRYRCRISTYPKRRR